MIVRALCIACVCACAASFVSRAGTTCRTGVAEALPVKDGKPPVIDGKLGDWDRTGAILCWNAEAYADKQNATVYFMYDRQNLYFAVEMGLFDHDYTNPNRPEDRYWAGDCIQLRLSTDRSLPYPLPQKDRRNPPGNIYYRNDKVTCVNLWKNSSDGSDNLYVTPGANFDMPGVSHPTGSAVKAIAGEKSLTIEARIPWSAVGVRDGVCPFRPGERMTACVDIKWHPGSDGHYTSTVYKKDPGAFAFLNLAHWGQVEFKEKGGLPPLKESYASVVAAAKAMAAADTKGCAEIRFCLPKAAKVSVNVFDDKGGVVRELAGGEPHDAGDVVFYWDGRDALGFPCETEREYRWGAYAHDGLDVTYFGTVGTSGEPPYDSRSGRGGWGSDHGPVVDVAVDDSGRYFIWHQAEAGKGLVKTDFDGNVIWRTAPFAVSGEGNYTCGVSDGEYLFLAFERRGDRGMVVDKPLVKLVRVDVKSGNYERWPGNLDAADLPVSGGKPGLPSQAAVRDIFAFNIVGIAVSGDELFVSDFAADRIHVLDKATAKPLRTLSVPGPRGLWMRGGALYAVSLRGRPSVVRVDPKSGKSEPVVSSGLECPHGLAVADDGTVYVSDLGSSQQIKQFDRDGRLSATLGKRGGRGFVGRIDLAGFLYPFGLAVDKKGVLLVTEAAAPKIVTLFDTATLRPVRRYYGYTAYSPSNVPDCDDPLLQYYSISGPECFARARIPEKGGSGLPDAIWDFPGAGIGEFGAIMDTMNMPVVLRATNGCKYLVADGTADFRMPTAPKVVCLIDGDDMKPVAACLKVPSPERYPKRNEFDLWTDANGDGRVQDGEKTRVSEVGGRKFRLADHDGSFLMTENGEAFVLTQENFLIGIPCRGFTTAGVPNWDAAAAYVAIPEILPGYGNLHCSWRHGLSGFRRDKDGNFYASVTADPKYATDAYTKYMKQGMGHTADVGAVFMTKYDPSGRLIWRTGRKAVGGMKDGEMLHHWVYAGLVADEYSVAASEWGVFTFYTKDGFYVDHVFDVPGFPGKGIPYAFSGEDFSGRVAWYPKRGELWAFNAGHTFKVIGFDAHGRVKGEWRTAGTVRLEMVKPLVFPGAEPKALSDVRLVRRGDRLVFSAHVADATPLDGVAKDPSQVFKGGDAVGFEIGPDTKPRDLPERRPSGRYVGFTRVLAARLGGRDVAVAFKPFTDGVRIPQMYETAGGGCSAFEFCGEIPGATVSLVVDRDGKGYSAEVSVPLSFLELDFSKRVYYDAEALLSGEGGRGLQTVQKVYLHTPDSSPVLMVDDAPTEARLHPHGWVELK